MSLRSLAALTLVAAIGVAACASDDDASDTPDTADTSVADSVADTASSDAPSDTESDVVADPGSDAPDVVAGEPFPEERCAANKAAGTVTFLTGFDFAAASSIVEVVNAEAAGYYDALCLDVEIRPGSSTENYPLVASGTAQFASGGSFSEVVNFAAANDADFVAASVDGRSAIDTLIVKAGEVAELADLEGTTIGVKFKLPPSIEVMLRGAGLVEGENFDTLLLDGFDPLAHIEIPSIVGLPGWKSNEVGTLSRAGIGVELFDPLDFGVPGSFGVIFTTASFIAEHPTAAQDFMRATMRGLADAIADPAAAAQVSVEALNANGNPFFFSAEGETFRWETEANLILEGTPDGVGFGVPDPALLQGELDAYAAVGLFGDVPTPTAADFLDPSITDDIVDAEGTIIFPG